jgi:hypothetical protein
MKKSVLKLALAGIVFTGASAALAGPFNPKDVAADPAVLVHVDCDALKSSTVGQSILGQPEVSDKLAAVGALFDFDFRKQLHGLTVYTTEEHSKDGALIVYADFDPERLITLAKMNDGFQSTTNGSHVIYSWLDDKKKTKDGERPRMCGAIMGHRVIIGQNEAHLAEALDVIEGKSPSFSGKKGLEEAQSGESILVQGLMLKFDFDGADQNAAVFKMSKSVRLKLSEANSTMTAKVRFEAADADTANNIGSIAQGLLAFLKMQKSDDNAMKLANAIAIKQDGATVGVTLSVPSSELIQVIKEGEKKAEEKEAKAEEAKTTAENK